MVKGSLMKRLLSRLVIALLTFTAGVASSHLAYELLTYSASIIRENKIFRAFGSHSAESYCEVHGSILRQARLQRFCGEYSGSAGAGGWMRIATSCDLHRYDSPKKRQISPEDGPFLLTGVSLKDIEWMVRNEEARKARFPHGYGWAYEDCESGEEPCFKSNVCNECRAAEVAWKRKRTERSGQ